LVVWSQASIRSRPFLDAAQRVINADKAVVASLIEPPPPSSIGSSPVFDLTRWDGDPNDPQLDPLFFAVDRMVNSARASVGASAAPAAESAYEAPPRRVAAAPPPATPKPPTYTRPGADPLSSEAEHWRAIRDSRNPSDFMDHLARFGPEGAFAEVAELRLKQLTAAQESRTPTPTPRPTTPAPQQRAPIAPRVAMPPTRSSESTPARRYEAPPAPARRPEPARRPPPPERYDRDLRDPPRGEGGPLRALILVVLLGGAALAGGLYFGGGMNDLGGAATQEEQQVAEAPATGEPESYSDDPAGPDAISLGEAIDPAPRRVAPPRRETPPPREATRQPDDSADRAAAPTTSWAGNSTATNPGGPVSLQPGASQPTTPTTSPGPVTLAPAASPTSSDPAPTTTRPTTPTRAATVSFSARPSARRISDLYPNRALRDGVGGRAVLDCTVASALTLNCSVASETPAGLGFGQAALSASNSYRANAQRSDGSSAVGQSTRIVVQFQAPAE
jgi:protein TonB